MDNSSALTLDPEVFSRYTALQTRFVFTRTTNGKLETVGYQPDCAVRLWYNDLSSDYPLHWHPAVEMIVPIEGHYPVSVGQEVYELDPGDILIIPSRELHSLPSTDGGSRFILLFEMDLMSRIQGYSSMTAYLSKPVLISAQTCRPIYHDEMNLMSQLCLDYLQDSPLREINLYNKLLTFFLNYVKYQMSLEGPREPASAVHARQKDLSERLNAVMLYLDDHFAEDLTLEKAANVAGFSKFHFSRIFKQCSGQNFYDYLAGKRIKSAEILLMMPGLSVTEVALQSGFSSLSTFNRTFKKVKGCTPSEYRSLYNSALIDR